jgi:hypothetical protein
MSGAYPKALPVTLGIGAAVTAHRHVRANDTVDFAAVNPIERAIALRAAQGGERRMMYQPPPHAQRDHQQRTENQDEADGIRKGCPLQRSGSYPTKTSEGVLKGPGNLPKPLAQRTPDVHLLEDQKDAEGDNRQPNDLEPIGSQKPPQTVRLRLLGYAHRLVSVQRLRYAW